MIRFIYSGNETAITNITNLDLLFEICRLADKVTIHTFSFYAQNNNK